MELCFFIYVSHDVASCETSDRVIESRASDVTYLERVLTCHFRASLKHKDDGQTKFIKPNSQRQDIIIKYWVSIGSIHREQG